MDKACDKLHVYCDGFVKIVIQIGFAIFIFKIGIKTNVDSAMTYQYKEKQASTYKGLIGDFFAIMLSTLCKSLYYRIYFCLAKTDMLFSITFSMSNNLEFISMTINNF